MPHDDDDEDDNAALTHKLRTTAHKQQAREGNKTLTCCLNYLSTAHKSTNGSKRPSTESSHDHIHQHNDHHNHQSSNQCVNNIPRSKGDSAPRVKRENKRLGPRHLWRPINAISIISAHDYLRTVLRRRHKGTLILHSHSCSWNLLVSRGASWHSIPIVCIPSLGSFMNTLIPLPKF